MNTSILNAGAATTMRSAGLFINIEGMEGAGKGTAISWSQEYLAKFQLPLVWSREPGGTRLGEAIRELLLDRADLTIGLEAELLLCFASRVQHLRERIQPALAQGQIVVCDRFTDSTYAYQGYARGGSLTQIARLERLVQGNLRPDITLLLEVPVAVGLQRIRTARTQLDRIEREQEDFFTRVRQGYQALATQHAERYYIIHADCSLAQLQAQLRQFWQRVLRRFFSP